MFKFILTIIITLTMSTLSYALIPNQMVIKECLFHDVVYESYSSNAQPFPVCSFQIGQMKLGDPQYLQHRDEDHQPHDPECFRDRVRLPR